VYPFAAHFGAKDTAKRATAIPTGEGGIGVTPKKKRIPKNALILF